MYDEQTIFLAVPLLRYVWKREYPVTCANRECQDPATHVRTRIRQGARRNTEDGRFSASTSFQTSSWCAGHLSPQVKRTKFEIVDDLERVYAIIAALDEKHDGDTKALAQHHADLRASEIAASGRVRILSGYAGVLYERSDGRCELAFASPGVERRTEIVCRHRHGAWLVDTRARGRRLGDPNAHGDECTAAAAAT